MSSAPQTAGRGRRFIINVLWSWASVGVNIVVAALLSPYIIRQLGEEKFGLWTVSLSFIEYFWLIDIGLRSATVKFSAEYRAVGDTRSMTEVFNTGLLYSTLAGLLIAAAAFTGAGAAASFMGIHEPEFPFLIRIVGLSWAVGISMSILTAVLEGHQRFDAVSRVFLSGTIFRSAITAGLVASGYGLYHMGLTLFAAQILMAAIAFVLFRKLIAGPVISLKRATWAMLKRMASYGIHSFKVLMATRLLYQSTPLLIASFLPLSNVAYYTVPSKILDYLSEAIGRVGMVTMPNATELFARGDRGGIIKLGILANRYSLMLFAPCAVFLLAYASELCALWISPSFGANSAYLIPVFLIGSTVVAGQHNSVSVLFGIGRHQRYSTCLLIEAVVTVVCFALVLPRFGLIGAACVSAVLTTLNRGGVACLLVSRELDISPSRYAASIYLRPLAAAGVCCAAILLLKPWVPGTTWSSLILAGALTVIIYLPLAITLCVPREHRELLMQRLRHALARQRT